MLATPVVEKYAQALYQLACERHSVDQIERELQTVAGIMASQPALRELLHHPRVPVGVKKDTIQRIFSQDVSTIVLNFLLLLADKRREAQLGNIITAYTELVNAGRDLTTAEVTTAMPLPAEQQAALAERLTRLTGKKVVLRTRLNPQIIGGLIVKIGDKLIDGSVLRQLRTLKKTLTSAEVKEIGVTE